MTSRERLTNLFQGKKIDRLPIWLLAPFHDVEYYSKIYKNENYKKLIPYIEKYCDTFDRRNYNEGFCYNDNFTVTTEEITEGKGSKIITKAQYDDIVFEKVIDSTSGQTKVTYFVDEAEQLLEILKVPYKFPMPDFSQYKNEKAELGDKGLMMMDIGDPLKPLYHLMSAENFSMMTLTDPEILFEFLDEMNKRVIEYYTYFLEHNIGEVFFIVGAEFAGPPLVSPAMFEELSAKFVKSIVDLIRSYDKYSIVHYHGQLKRILQGMKHIGCDGLHTIEAPPTGDCTITEAREVLNDMILIGNIQYDDIANGTTERVRELTKQACLEGKTGRFIISPTAGPYDDNISEKAIDNYITFIETAMEYGTL